MGWLEIELRSGRAENWAWLRVNWRECVSHCESADSGMIPPSTPNTAFRRRKFATKYFTKLPTGVHTFMTKPPHVIGSSPDLSMWQLASSCVCFPYLGIFLTLIRPAGMLAFLWGYWLIIGEESALFERPSHPWTESMWIPRNRRSIVWCTVAYCETMWDHVRPCDIVRLCEIMWDHMWHITTMWHCKTPWGMKNMIARQWWWIF